MDNKRIYLALLSGGERDHWINPFLCSWLFAGTTAYDHEVGLDIIYNKRPHSYARYVAAKRFLSSGFPWLCMIDNDICPPNDLFRILEGVEEPCVLTPIMYIWTVEKSFSITATKLDPKTGESVSLGPDDEIPEGRFEIPSTGAGCILIHRDVFLGTKEPWFTEPRNEKTGEFLKGEDYAFSARVIRAGFKIYADSHFAAGHLHTVDFLALHEWATRLLLLQKKEPEPRIIIP